MTPSDDGVSVEHAASAVPTLPPVPASVHARPVPSAAMPPSRRPRWRVRVALAVAVGMAAGLALGVVGTTITTANDTRDARPTIVASSASASISRTGGSARGEQVISAVLAAAPRCTPDIRIAGAPAAERVEFVDEARQLATEAANVDGLLSVRWRVIQRDGRLFGVLYGERCEGSG